MLSYSFQIAIKLLFTCGLLLLISFCGVEIWRLWFDRTLILVPFGYTRDGDLVRESGQHFVQLVNQDLQLVRDLYSNQSGEDIAIPSIDQIGRGDIPALPVIQNSVFSEIEIQAYGIQLSDLMKTFTRWIEHPSEIVGNISERGDRITLYAELRSATPTTSQGKSRWHLSQMANIDDTSFALSSRIFGYLMGQESSLYQLATEEDFYLFTLSLRSYQLYRTRLGHLGPNEEATQALSEASQNITVLMNRKSQFPFVYKLAAYIFREEGQLPRAKEAIQQYLQILAERSQVDGTTYSDKQAQELNTLLEGTQIELVAEAQSADAEVNRRSRIRPIQPAISVGTPITSGGSVGTICCFVRDQEEKLYVLSSNHVFTGEIRTPILQPSSFDGGMPSDQIAVLTRVLPTSFDGPNHVAGAIAQLVNTIQPSLEIPGIGRLQGIASPVEPGQIVRSIGRTSNLTEGTVTGINVSSSIWIGEKTVLFDGLIQTTSISAAGDSGAPVVTSDGKLVGMIYAGSATTSLVIPIQPILDAFDVELVY